MRKATGSAIDRGLGSRRSLIEFAFWIRHLANAERRSTEFSVRLVSANAKGIWHVQRFFLNVHSDIDASDREGHLYPDLDTAKTHAANGAREMIAEDVLQGRPIVGTHRVQIIDESGEIRDTVMFSDVVSCLDSPASE